MNYRSPLASRDGTKVFVRTELPKTEIVRFDRVSGRFVTLPPGISARTADFSRDGERIAFGSVTDNNLWRCKADGSELLPLTNDFQQVAMPHWSHSGRLIAFMGRRWGQKWGIFLVSAAGGKVDSLSVSGKGEADPDWSPDGSQLVFGNLLEEPGDAAIYTVDLKDRRVGRLPGSTGYFSPRWSPDGRAVAAIHVSDRRMDVFHLSSGTWTNLTMMNCGYPNWSHDGRFVYFLSSPGGRRGIWRVGLADHEVEEVASLVGVEQPPVIFGTWIGLGPEDTPLALRNLTTEDIYAWGLVGR
jgi:Tol biopolymer transport system component